MSDIDSGVTKKVIGNAVYEIIPTEKGYAYVITLSMCIVLVNLFGYTNSLGMLFNNFLMDIGAGVGGLTLIYGLLNACVSISGIFANVAMKKFSLRQVSLMGSTIYTLSWFMTSFAQNLQQLMVTFTLMGLGTGILYSVAFTCFNSYFVSNKRIMLVSFSQSMVCVGYIVIPIMIEKLLVEYGYRGTILLYSAIIGHVIFASICMHPLEWHSPKKLLYNIVKETEDGIDLQNLAKDQSENAKFTVRKVNEENGNSSNKLLTFIVEILDISLLKDIVLINLLIGGVVALLSDITFFTVFPQYLYDFGLDTAQVAIVLTVLGASDLVGRLFLVFFTKFFDIKSEPLFYFGTIMTTVARIIFLFSNNLIFLYIITAALGFFRSFIQTLYALVFADYIPEKFPAAIGWAMLLFGSISLPLMSFIGFLYEKTGDCMAGFITLTILNFFLIVPWTYKILYFRKKQYRR